jgi:beta-1,2-mannobiose phosphorylase / 1,2-beta-oligomannan phosphorylase
MVNRLFERLLLRPADVQPSRDDLEVIGVFNPGAVLIGDEVVLLVRVSERPLERRPGFTALPRWAPESGLVVDWVPDDQLEPLDPRVVRIKRENGLVRLTFVSHLRLVRCGDGRSVEAVDDLVIMPESSEEEFGVEDPRITRIGDRYYITYVAVSRHGAATALASTTDFRRFERHGIIFCTENKDVVLFPEKIGGEYVALHRPNGATPFTQPEMWLARSPDLIHWGRHKPLHGGTGPWETGRTGAGPPPIRVPEGWLALYHGNRRPTRPGEVGTYAAGALLLDAGDPALVRRRTPEPILKPTADFERQGFVADIVFPTGIVETDGRVLVYYGAADTFTAVVEFARDELVAALA